MKNIKLQKKQSFFELYKKYIINVFSFASIIGVILCTYFYPVLMRDIFIIVAKLCGFSIVFVLISLLIDFIIYIKRQLYIPLTKDELDKSSITTVKEYNRFLIKYLKGFKPFPKLQEQIVDSAKEAFTEEWDEINKIYHYRDYNWTTNELKKYYSNEEIGQIFNTVNKFGGTSILIGEYMFKFCQNENKKGNTEYEANFIKRISNHTLTREDILNSKNPFYFSYNEPKLNHDYKELMFYHILLIRLLMISSSILAPTLFILILGFEIL